MGISLNSTYVFYLKNQINVDNGYFNAIFVKNVNEYIFVTDYRCCKKYLPQEYSFITYCKNITYNNT